MEKNNSNNIIQFRSAQPKTKFSVGCIFLNIQEFMERFTTSAIIKNIFFKVKRRNSKRVELICGTPECLFCVSAHVKADKHQCVVTKMNPFHQVTCQLTGSCSTTLIKKIMVQRGEGAFNDRNCAGQHARWDEYQRYSPGW